jgi:hypothetical protein
MKTFTQVMLLAGLAGAAVAAPTAADAQVYVRVGPPRPVYERRPPPRPGYAWQAGYQRWDGNRYIWVPGAYMAPPRPRARWVAGRWAHGPRGYYYRGGVWR